MRSLLPRYGFKELTAFSMKLDTSASAILLPVSRARARCTTAASWGRFKKGIFTYDSGSAQLSAGTVKNGGVKWPFSGIH
jgi:hypothetical protein